MSTYGNERDRLAHALISLLTAEEPALGRTDACRVLQYREAVLSNLTSISDAVLGGAPAAKPTLSAVSAAPARALRTTLHTLPKTGDPVAPSDVFAAAPRNGYVRRWHTAAQASLLAADALATGQPTRWRVDPDAAWSVMADTSAAAHALAVLDHRLATHPSEHFDDRARDALNATWRTGLRLIASEVSRLAQTQPLSDQADHLARPPKLLPFPVSDPNQLVVGYQQFLRMLQARDGVLPIRVLGHVLVAQARIAHTLANGCQRVHTAGVPRAEELAHRWRDRAVTGETLAAHRRAVTGLNPATQHPSLAQLGEVLRGLDLGSPKGREHAQSVARAYALDPVGAEVEQTLAAGIERAFARDLYLVPNERVSKRRDSLSWVSVHKSTEEHPLLTTARSIRATPSRALQPDTAEPGAAQARPAPHVRHELHRALATCGPARSGPPSMTMG
ncbi:MAG TPA: hypothetical protein VNP20_08450 [Nocardioidaceae bacterium]|nr:hypothetical protein [Nocardioidaceae bacterium]